MIEVKAPITGWHEVTAEQALRFAASRYVGMTCSKKYEKLRKLIKGIEIDEQTIKDYIRNNA